MRRWHASVPLLLIGLAACDAAAARIAQLRGLEPSPFAFFGRDDMRAGIAFDRLDEAALREQKQRYRCEAAWADHRKCSLRVDPGTMVAIVDPKGRIIRLGLTTEDSLLKREEGVGQRPYVFENHVDGTRAAWDSVAPGRAGALRAGRAEHNWSDPRGEWSATLWYGSRLVHLRNEVARQMPLAHRRVLADSVADAPDSMAITNDSAYAAFLGSRPPTEAGSGAAPVGPGDRSGTGDSPSFILPPREMLALARRDLEVLVRAQEEHQRAKGRPAARLDDLLLVPDDSVLIELRVVGRGGWIATATHRALPGLSCVVFGGAVPRAPRTRRDGLGAPAGYVACDLL